MGVPKILLEREENPENGVDVEMGGLPLFLLLYSSIAFTVCVCVCVCVCVGWGGGGGV